MIALDEAHEIGEYLAATYARESTETPKQQALRALTKIKCLRCHVPETVFRSPPRTPKEWTQLNKRMWEKSPSWMSDREVKNITRYLIRKMRISKN